MSWNLFYGHSLPSADSIKAGVSFRMCTVLINHLYISLPSKCFSQTEQLDMTKIHQTPKQTIKLGWLGVAKMSCILRQLGWCPTVKTCYNLVAGKGRGKCFLPFLHFHSFPSFFSSFLSSPVVLFLSLFLLSLRYNTKWRTKVETALNPNTINQSNKHTKVMGMSVNREIRPSPFYDPRPLASIMYLGSLYTVIFLPAHPESRTHIFALGLTF